MRRFSMPLARIQTFFLKAGLKPKVVELRSKQIIFARGDLGNAAFMFTRDA
jgi:hypothetical protein